MASKHQLSLELPDTNNTKVMRILDTSLYAPDLQLDCATLSILPPGFSIPVTINVTPGFNLILNACDLGLQTTGCLDTPFELPDGIYTVTYSVSPNDKVFVEYAFLRVTSTLTKYFEALCTIEVGACEPNADVKEQFKEITFIKNLIDAAKVKVEWAHRRSEGIELLTYAQKRLAKWLSSNSCSSCNS